MSARHPMTSGIVCVLGACLFLAASLSAVAQDRAAPREREAWDLERAFVELERLRAEIVTLRGLAGAQAALLAWNSEKAESGAGPAVLAVHLCAEPALAAWCRVLPATFGADAAQAAGHRQARDGER